MNATAPRLCRSTAYKRSSTGELFLQFNGNVVTALRPGPFRAWTCRGGRWQGTRYPNIRLHLEARIQAGLADAFSHRQQPYWRRRQNNLARFFAALPADATNAFTQLPAVGRRDWAVLQLLVDDDQAL